MHLYFLRHGEADWPNWNKPDDERPLTKRGKAEMKKVAAFLERLQIPLEQVVTSPLPRAQQTAEIVARKLEINLSEDRKLAPGFDSADLKRLLKDYTGEHIMVVGHNPDFTETISALTGASLWLFPPKIAKVARRA
jgi:phosphohistidine phosphatase